MEPEKKMIEISEKMYLELLKDSRTLKCLLGAGVDNWDGYSDALTRLVKRYPEYRDEDDEDMPTGN